MRIGAVTLTFQRTPPGDRSWSAIPSILPQQRRRTRNVRRKRAHPEAANRGGPLIVTAIVIAGRRVGDGPASAGTCKHFGGETSAGGEPCSSRRKDGRRALFL